MDKLFGWLRKENGSNSEHLETTPEEEYDFDFYDVIHNFEKKAPHE